MGKLSSKLSPSARLEHGRLTSLINSMADGVIAVDKQTRIVIYNGAALNILDRNDPIEHKFLNEVFHPIDKEGQAVTVGELFGTVRMPTANRDMRLKYADGSIVNLYISIAPVRLGYRGVGQEGYVVLLRDITREKSVEEERDEFISVVSHELRTPIAITEGNISNAQFIVKKSGDLEKVKQALDEAHNQILFLADLVNDLSTLARAERGKLEVEAGEINIANLLTELASNYQPEAEAKTLKLHAEIASDIKTVHSSELYLREILQNFITNALKYTEHGSITITAKRQNDNIILAVSDTGIGISKGDKERIFEKFFRSEDYRTRKTNGTGLGLYVTTKLAQLIHADITFTSQLNKGSTFSITIPDTGLKKTAD